MDHSSNYEDYRLGSVLKLLFLIPEQEIQLALSVSHDTGMPLGSVLIAQGKLKSHELRISIHTQSLLKDSLVDTEKINLAARHLKEQPLGIEGALKMIGWHRNLERPSNRLGELLIRAGVLTPLQLTKALAQQRLTLEPLGQALARLSFIPRKALRKVLSIQEVIRSGLLDRVNGVQLINHVCAKYKSPAKSKLMGPEFVETLINMPSRGADSLLRSVDHLIDSTSKVPAPSPGSDEKASPRKLFKRFEEEIGACNKTNGTSRNTYGYNNELHKSDNETCGPDSEPQASDNMAQASDNMAQASDNMAQASDNMAQASQEKNLEESDRSAYCPARTSNKQKENAIGELRRTSTRTYGKWSRTNCNLKQQILELKKACMNATGSLKLIGPLW